MLVIIDYGMGNLGSIKNMLKKIGVSATISFDPSIIESASGLILPGVGAFDSGMKNIRNLGLVDLLNELALNRSIPILGICLGMQIMTKSSKEGILPGLSWIDANTIKFCLPSQAHLKTPNMGWNTINIKQKHPLIEGINSDSMFYFVHSYYVCCNNPDDVLSTTNYGIEFTSSFARQNIMGVQFHPEKSQTSGIMVLKNLAHICGEL